MQFEPCLLFEMETNLVSPIFNGVWEKKTRLILFYSLKRGNNFMNRIKAEWHIPK